MTNHDPANDHPAVIPDDLAHLLTTDHIGHVSFLRDDGTIATTLMWVDWDGEHVLTSSPIGEFQGRRLRANPTISVSVVDHADDWRFIAVEGRVTEIRPDTDLVFIDKLAQRYTGSAYRRRNYERETFVITPDRIRYGHGGWAPRRR
jgi:PPOX class probable F420-dependent enzyme